MPWPPNTDARDRAGSRGLVSGLVTDVDTILVQRWLFVAGRVVITFMYWFAALGFVLDFPGAVTMVRGYGLEPAGLMAGLTIVVLLAGSALVIDGRLAWLGAGMLGLFTVATIPLIHHFWTMTGAAATQARLESEEHVTVIGGLILTSILCYRRTRHLRSA
jgi:transmembrane protein